MKKQLTFILCFVFTLGAFGQDVITGKVINASDGLPIPGVNVIVKGDQSRGVATGLDGAFSLKVGKNTILIFSAIGMKTIQLPAKKAMEVMMSEETSALEEVVVVGYGETTKESLTGSISQLKPKAYENQPVLNTSSALQGRVSGVSISNTSGAPGGEVKIRIRGANSINNDNSPLIVVDGVAMGSLGLQDY